jgi:hypothetical protein
MTRFPWLTISTSEEIHSIVQHPPTHQYTVEEIEEFLRDLHEQYPESRLLVAPCVDLIETSCSTGARSHHMGFIAVLEHLQPPYPARRYLLKLLGGPTGHESFYVPPEYQFIDWSQSGWSACAGTARRTSFRPH